MSMAMGLLFGGLSALGAYQLGQDPRNFTLLLGQFYVLLCIKYLNFLNFVFTLKVIVPAVHVYIRMKHLWHHVFDGQDLFEGFLTTHLCFIVFYYCSV